MRADGHGFDVLSIEQLAIVGVDLGFALADVRILLGIFGMVGVNVADGHDVAEVNVLAGVPAALATHIDAQPSYGRSLAEMLAKVFKLFTRRTRIVLPAAAATRDFFKNTQREGWFRVMAGISWEGDKKRRAFPGHNSRSHNVSLQILT